MGVFGDYALKYLEQGYVVFPVIGKGGEGQTPSGWSSLKAQMVINGKFDKGFLKTPQEIEKPSGKILKKSIQVNYSDCNIALLCGEVSGVIGFDIDTDDPQIVSLINQFIPQSRCVKRGSKGETRFFKYTKEFAQTERKGIYDLLSNGSYSVMPPSIHPETKEPYVELGESLYYLSPDDLSCIDAKEYEKLKNIIDGMTEYKGEGRDNRLSRIGFAMACRGEPLESIAEELLKVDLTHHKGDPKGCFFQDTKETKVRGKTPQQAATSFAKRCIQDATKKGLVSQKTPTVESLQIEEIEEPILSLPPLPKFLDNLALYFGNGTSNKNGAFLSSLVFMSLFLGRRIEFYDPKRNRRTAPNIFCFYIASSSDGKGELQNRVSDLIEYCDKMCQNIEITGIPKSDAALSSERFFEKPVVGLFSEEFHQIMTAIAMGNKLYAAMAEVLSNAYSASTGSLKSQKAREEKYDNAKIKEPYLTVFAATQPFNFKHKILGTKNWGDVFHQGLGGRMLYAQDFDNEDAPLMEFNQSGKEDIVRDLQSICKFVAKEQLKTKIPQIEYEKNFISLLDALIEEAKREKKREEIMSGFTSIMSPIIGRRIENALKISLILCVCEILEGRPLILEGHHLLKAVDICKYCEAMIDKLVYGEKLDPGEEKVLNRIKQSGKVLLTAREIARKNSQKSEDVLQHLMKLKEVKLVKEYAENSKRGRKRLVWGLFERN